MVRKPRAKDEGMALLPQSAGDQAVFAPKARSTAALCLCNFGASGDICSIKMTLAGRDRSIGLNGVHYFIKAWLKNHEKYQNPGKTPDKWRIQNIPATDTSLPSQGI